MVGANYMGGKRNYVRSKGKDRETRLQKNFFGKQKLQLLSKGLSTRKGFIEASGEVSASVADISLAHARQKIPLDSRSSTTRGVSWIPEPAYVPGSAFGSTSSPANGLGRFRVAHMPSSRTRTKAKILQKLDTTEPYCLKLLLERIRTTPDLAGLSRRSSGKEQSISPKILLPTRIDKLRVQERRFRPEEAPTAASDPDYNIQDAREASRKSPWDDCVRSALEDSDPYTAGRPPASPVPAFNAPDRYAEDEMEAEFDSPAFSSMEMPDSSVVFEDQTRYFDAGSVGEASSSSRPFQMLSSPPTSVDKSVRAGRILTPGPDRRGQHSRTLYPPPKEDATTGSPSSLSEHHDWPGSEGSHFDEKGLPLVIRLPKPTDKTLQRQCSVYGTLFTYPDPWSVIGDILSQSAPGEGYEDESRDRQAAEEAEMRNRNRDSEWNMSFINNGVEDETEDDAEAPHEELVNDELFEELDFEDDQRDEGLGLDVLLGREGDEYDEVMFGVEDPSLGPDRCKVPYGQSDCPFSVEVQQSVLQNGLQRELDSPDRGGTGRTFGEMLDGPCFRCQTSSPLSQVCATPPLDDRGQLCEQQGIELDNTYNSPDPYALEMPTADPQLNCCSATPEDGGEAAMIESGACATGAPDYLNLLEVPELAERNGKWVGPSLFFDDEDDDEF